MKIKLSNICIVDSCQNIIVYYNYMYVFLILQLIVEKYQKEKSLPKLEKSKFLVPKEITVSQFVTIIR